MTERVQYWGMMTPRQVRIGSLVAIGGLVCKHVLLPQAGPFWVRMTLELFGGLGGWILLMWIAVSAPGWRGVQPGELDERELAERHKSFAIAYRVTGCILMSLYFYGLGVTRYDWWRAPTAATAFALLWSLAWIHAAMPGIILAWREPRDDED